ncbi:MAG: hypothetical protein M3512_07400 [Bacteroidota bacterium]|nr:hypothetical protein [Bacteroidota bacterium]
MLEIKIFSLLIMVRSIFCGCAVEPKSTGFKKNKGEYYIESMARLPRGFLEASGLETSDDPDVYFTHTDSGGKNHLYRITPEGNILDTLIVEDAKNTDWEDLAKDDQGNIFIGDFGNNLNQRKDLRIYKFNPITKGLEIINFKFQDQDQFPPDRENMNFDVEGFFWKDGALHLFSKNRGLKCVKHYEVPDAAGDYTIAPVKSFYLNGMVTAADISTDNKMFALLSYGKVYLFKLNKEGGVFDKPYKCLPFTKGGQSEGLVFINETDFLISNETGRLFLAWKKK